MTEPVGQQARYLDLLGEYDIEIIHRPGVPHRNSDALSRRPCERAEDSTICRQSRRTKGEKECRTVRVMTRRQRAATAKLEGRTRWNSGFGIDLSPDGIRQAQRNEDCLRIIMDLLETSTEKPSWSVVEGADSDVQQLYAK